MKTKFTPEQSKFLVDLAERARDRDLNPSAYEAALRWNKRVDYSHKITLGASNG